MFKDKRFVKNCKFFKSLNLHRTEVTGETKSIQKVMKAWRAVITYAHPENGGSQEWWDRVNMAYECLSNGWCRIAYVDALIRFNLDDGQVVYVEF